MWYYAALMIKDNQPRPSHLPYYSKDTFHSEEYKVKEFAFYNQDSQLVTRNNFANKIWVSEFFFSTCEGICPIMNSNLSIVQDSFANDSSILFLSHTVDPETDKVAVLKAYADRFHAIKNKWHFVTGDKEEIYNLARTSYFSATPKDSSLKEDFVHSQLLCLIDPHLHIRGYYDGTNGKSIAKLIRDIRLLEAEYELDNRKKVFDIFYFLHE
jgi:protein SCO1/2